MKRIVACGGGRRPVSCLAPAASAQVANGSTREKLVVTPAWLAEHLADRDLVILQVGTQGDLRRRPRPRRAPGQLRRRRAGRADGPQRRQPDHVMLEMPDTEVAPRAAGGARHLRQLQIVVVPADNYWSPSTRIVLTLDYAGLSNVMWLDGGTKGWADYGRALTAEVPAVKPGNLSPLKVRPIVVDEEFVLDRTSASPASRSSTRATGASTTASRRSGRATGRRPSSDTFPARSARRTTSSPPATPAPAGRR